MGGRPGRLAVEVYAAIRRFVFPEGHSRREAVRVFGLSRETVQKLCRFSLPPGYTRTLPIPKLLLSVLLQVNDTILEVTSVLRPSNGIWTSGFLSGCVMRMGLPVATRWRRTTCGSAGDVRGEFRATVVCPETCPGWILARLSAR